MIAYRLLVHGTMAERMWELQQREAGLVRDVLGEDNPAASPRAKTSTRGAVSPTRAWRAAPRPRFERMPSRPA